MNSNDDPLVSWQPSLSSMSSQLAWAEHRNDEEKVHYRKRLREFRHHSGIGNCHLYPPPPTLLSSPSPSSTLSINRKQLPSTRVMNNGTLVRMILQFILPLDIWIYILDRPTRRNTNPMIVYPFGYWDYSYERWFSVSRTWNLVFHQLLDHRDASNLRFTLHIALDLRRHMGEYTLMYLPFMRAPGGTNNKLYTIDRPVLSIPRIKWLLKWFYFHKICIYGERKVGQISTDSLASILDRLRVGNVRDIHILPPVHCINKERKATIRTFTRVNQCWLGLIQSHENIGRFATTDNYDDRLAGHPRIQTHIYNHHTDLHNLHTEGKCIYCLTCGGYDLVDLDTSI